MNAQRVQSAPLGAIAHEIAVAAKSQHVTLAITADAGRARALEAGIAFFLDASTQVVHFPDREILPYDVFAPHPELISERIAALATLPRSDHLVLVLSIATALERLPPPSFFAARAFDLKAGSALQLEPLRAQLIAAGYRHVRQVLEPGEFAVRGSLLDVFPMGLAAAYRIELFDDEVETIRTFDPETQRSIAQMPALQLLPAREFPTDDTALERARRIVRDRFHVDPRKSAFYQDLKSGQLPGGIEHYLPLFFDDTATLADYLPHPPQLWVEEGVAPAAQTFLKQAAARYEQRRHDPERPVLPVEALYLEAPALFRSLGDEAHGFVVQRRNLALAGQGVGERLRELAQQASPLMITADSAGRRERLIEHAQRVGVAVSLPTDWATLQRDQPPTALLLAPFDDGFVIDGRRVVTDRELFSEDSAPVSRRRRDRDPDAIIRDLTDLADGAPVVHEDQGVGRYRGLTTLGDAEAATEFLLIEYRDGDKLYVPVANLHLVSRYTGASAEHAPWHKLGGEQWAKAKKKAAEKVRDVAAELLALQAKRAARGGQGCEIERDSYRSFAGGFPFEETPDQATAIQAVLDDIADDKSMDRVVCGDVGFGKTEVALRAAFAAVQCGRQVGILAPTTLLAQQHFRNFSDRFADWPIRIELLSRLQSTKAAKATLEAVRAGQVDIVIGTHRLLQKDVDFKALGLIIVDEEQRFGVRQKERLKALRAEVDLLTLTATPIPRTLNMALGGLRDLSIIATPPPNRVAVKTFVGQWDAAVLREAFQRELGRGGQVFFLHNEVRNIDSIARDVQALAPNARIRVAHGQMPERELEQVMVDFYRQRFNVLVCTTIIENGIDVPNANTIVVNRADRFGLAQLHQLRGRVGRSHHRAFAYLLVPDRRSMTADARKRIEAIASMEELGAGFMLATHDLEIRGAGDLLGEDQSGQIEAVGFALYSEMLSRAVEALKRGDIPDLDQPLAAGPDIELGAPALIPDDYLPDVHTRLVLYKRIASAKSEDALDALAVELIDRFGLLPPAVKNLFAVTAMKVQATHLGVELLELGEESGRVRFGRQPKVDAGQLIKLVQSRPGDFRFDGETLRLEYGGESAEQRLHEAQALLDEMRPMEQN